MYGEIQATHAEIFREKLKEGNVCLIKDFFVNTAKNKYKVVDGSFMMKITPWSKVEVQHNVPEDYPRYAYSLSDFKILPSMVGKTDSFIGKDILNMLNCSFVPYVLLRYYLSTHYNALLFNVQMLLEYFQQSQTS